MNRTATQPSVLRRWMPRVTALAAFVALGAGGPAYAQGQPCDCSCDEYRELMKTRDEYEAAVQSGTVTPPPAAITQMVTCSATCAQSWAACPEPGEAQTEAVSKDQLTPAYLQGTWCGIYGGQEPTEYRFRADGSYQIGVPAGGGFAMQPKVYSLEDFRERIGRLVRFEADQFDTESEHGRSFEFERGPCG